MRCLSKRLFQRGDTIVEVMIVLAVLGSAISISYATANRSLRNARQAQENAYATSLAQSQVERLRAYANVESGQPNYIYHNNGLFCFDTSGNVRTFGGVTPTPPDRTDYDNYIPECIMTDSQTFYVSIDYTASNGNFEVKVYWDDVVGSDKASTTLIYRVHEES